MLIRPVGGAPGLTSGSISPEGRSAAASLPGRDGGLAGCIRRLGDQETLQAELSRSLVSGADVSWDARTYGNGLAGIALALFLLQGDRERVGPRAHSLLAAAVDATREHPLTSSGLYDGAAGVDHVLGLFAAYDDRYAAASMRFRRRLCSSLVVEIAEGGCERASDLDLISGRAGWLLHLSGGAAEGDAPSCDLVHGLSADLARAIERSENPLLIVPADGRTERGRGHRGASETGLAHGAAGVLLALSAAYVSGSAAADAPDAIRRLAHAFLASAAEGAERRWPRTMTAAGPGHVSADCPAWCFGDIGIELALMRAGEALGDAGMRDAAATEILRQVEHDFIEGDARMTDASLCHGVAGVAVVHDAIRPVVDEGRWAAASSAVHARLEGLFDPAAPFGFGGDQHDPAFLMGAAGALVVLGGAADARAECMRMLTGAVPHA